MLARNFAIPCATCEAVGAASVLVGACASAVHVAAAFAFFVMDTPLPPRDGKKRGASIRRCETDATVANRPRANSIVRLLQY
jgi:hypothetical protein